MNKITETTRTVKVTDFVHENSPSLLISESVTGPSGRLRLFTQKIQVLDADLWQSLAADVKVGDIINITVKTVWPDSGPYYTVLECFAPIKAAFSEPILAAA